LFTVPNFSAYPFSRLRRLSRRGAQIESTVARWIGARSGGARSGRARLAKLVGAVRAEVVASGGTFDRFAARCEVRVHGAAIDVRGSSSAVRAIAQRLLGGPEELAAPRPLTIVERSIWSLVVATALEDLGVPGEVWPQLDDRGVAGGIGYVTDELRPQRDDIAMPSPSEDRARIGGPSEDKTRIGRPSKLDRADQPAAQAGLSRMQDNSASPVVELAVTLGDIALAVQILAPADVLLRAPPARAWPAWFATTHVEVPIVVGRCALHRRDVERLAVRSLVTLDRPAGAVPTWVPSRALAAELDVLGGSVALSASPGALEARVATEYVPREMSLPDDAHVELTVALGTTRLSLRAISELAVGQIIQLGRPLAGPFELRVAGRVVGHGELVDVDGELAVRIVSLGDQEQ
jgi:flagellar motor switch/type III secretory pathway protein FliN